MTQRRSAYAAVILAICLALSACGGNKAPKKANAAPTPSADRGQCAELTLAYVPGNGYEASAFLVGSLAESELGCEVTYRKTTSRKAWRLVARGEADAYLDAYGNADLREKLVSNHGPVTVVGPNGVQGGVGLLAPYFMAGLGLETWRDLADVTRIGWGTSQPALTTVPELLPLARAVVDFLELDYEVDDYEKLTGGGVIADLPALAQSDDNRQIPNLYLVEGPRSLLANGPGRFGGAAAGIGSRRLSARCPGDSVLAGRLRLSKDRQL
ncbi:MAG: glycine betaine ABC transporter substrate-binding protein [Nocardioidaceae bacterium]